MNLCRAIDLALPNLLVLAVDFHIRGGYRVEEAHFDHWFTKVKGQY